jgi:hypothetical protein
MLPAFSVAPMTAMFWGAKNASEKDCIVLKPQAYRVQREIRILDSHLRMFSEPVN